MESAKNPPSDATAASSSRHKKIETTASGIAQPTRNIFDPWNSASTGHQRAENRLSGSTSWRSSRNIKLDAQYRGFTGDKRVADTTGAESEEFGKDRRTANGRWAKGASGLRDKDQKSILESFSNASKTRHIPHETLDTTPTVSPDSFQPQLAKTPQRHLTQVSCLDNNPEEIPPSAQPSDLYKEQTNRLRTPRKQIFQNLCIYINGTTAPLISDHKLKYLLAQHGARTSIALGRRTVTHVILGNTYRKGGAGGGLAGSKIQKEVSRVGGKGIKFVSVEWVIESLKEGKRLPEARFESLNLAAMAKEACIALSKQESHSVRQPPTKDELVQYTTSISYLSITAYTKWLMFCGRTRARTNNPNGAQ